MLSCLGADEPRKMSRGVKKVAIIGGGVAGLLSLRHVLKYPFLSPTLFEASNKIGGVWAYDGQANQYGKHDHQTTPISAYRNLVSNQTKYVMEIRDFKHRDPSSPTFLPHKQVHDYLQGFADKFELENHIHFNHRVKNVSPVVAGTNHSPSWEVQVDAQHITTSHTFDSVIVCNGHFVTPLIPRINGFDYFEGTTLHSRYYRNPEDFCERKVMVIGAGLSGLDIAIDIARISTNETYICNRGTPLETPLPSNIIEVPEISHFNEDGHSLTVTDGRNLNVDTVIFATVFLHEYPFLSENCGIHVLENRVVPLFKQIVNVQHPSMFFVGVSNWMPLFPIMYLQAVYISKILSGEINLPPLNEMLSEQSHEFHSSLKYDWHPSKAHAMNDIIFEYADYLSDACSADRIPNYVKNIYLHVYQKRKQDVANYRNDAYSQEDFEL